MAQLQTEEHLLDVNDGTAMNVYTAATPEANERPGLIVLMEAFGVNDHIRDLTRRFARDGYVTVAPDLYHRTTPGFDAPYGDLGPVRAEMAKTTDEGFEADLEASYRWLQNHEAVDPSRIATIGFCMGGRVSFLANSVLDVQATVSFYGGGIAPDLLDRADRLNAPALLFWGGKDEHITREDRQAVEEALIQAQHPYTHVTFSEADHGFFCDRRSSYHAPSARQALALTREFYRNHL